MWIFYVSTWVWIWLSIKYYSVNNDKLTLNKLYLFILYVL